MAEILPSYAMMTVPQVGLFLGCSEEVAREMVAEGVIPSVVVGQRRHVDPIDVVVHVLAGREGIPASVYWDRHGEATTDHVRRYIARIRKVLAA